MIFLLLKKMQMPIQIEVQSDILVAFFHHLLLQLLQLLLSLLLIEKGVLVIDNQPGLFFEELRQLGATVFIGSVTDRDLVTRCLLRLSDGLDPGKVTARQVMTPRPTSIREEEGFDKALELMLGAGVRRLPVVDRRGKLRGVGFASYIEACGVAPSNLAGALGCGVGLWESAELSVTPRGMVEVLTGSHSHGQGHETTFAQLVSDRLGLPIDQTSASNQKGVSARAGVVEAAMSNTSNERRMVVPLQRRRRSHNDRTEER